ncbi:MAG: hypothetical protein A3F84_19150 [Candidatus Handelsmanbacteria bacterium RIFCSPLOWO2_12_FULL_64_10]|uniref:Uncharacterized protein n=1 Tax=Handelsmanbacteria sp. (strain RIFCSPLOWO2_12_FULL_64_10) TaxID=1817868 RepID=A0A1F6CR73_HANXR|nr:MAG: hypothetical protein A3F84_19150 [Candidatus Handelsmanbacteria bacterium RIFCSPLOWO2_12_FULL_64_10]
MPDEEVSRTANIRWVAAAGAISLLIVAGVAWYLLRPTRVTDIQDMHTLVERLDDMHKQIESRQQSIAEAVRNFNVTHPDDPIKVEDVKALKLKDLQHQILQRMVKAEKDVSYQGLLDEIGRQDTEISRLNNEIAAIQARLPEPVVAKRGDTHYNLSMKFLTEKKALPSEKAKEILDKMAVVEDVVPGFQVWMMYDETTGVFGSFVTQGTAPISPRRAQVRSKRALMARIEKAQEGQKKAEAQVETLVSEKAELQQQMEQTASALQAQVESARREKEEAQRLAEAKERERLEAERRLNSFFYTVGNLDELKRRGVVKGGGVGQAGGDPFSESLDLRLDTVVSLSAGDAGLGRIGSVKVFPSSLRKGRDYDIFYGSDRQLATVKVLNREAFLQARRVVFGIED